MTVQSWPEQGQIRLDIGYSSQDQRLAGPVRSGALLRQGHAKHEPGIGHIQLDQGHAGQERDCLVWSILCKDGSAWTSRGQRPDRPARTYGQQSRQNQSGIWLRPGMLTPED